MVEIYTLIQTSYIKQILPMLHPGIRNMRASIQTHGTMPINDNFDWGWDATYATDDTYMRKYSLDSRTKYNSNIYIEGLKGQKLSKYCSYKLQKFT